MSYNKTTKNYALPQWDADNKPIRDDFNGAFSTIDTQLANKVN